MKLPFRRETFIALRAARTAHRVATAIQNPPLVVEHKRRRVWARGLNYAPLDLQATDRATLKQDVLIIFTGIIIAIAIVAGIGLMAR